MKKYCFAFVFLFSYFGISQLIVGTFSDYKNQEITLKAFDGFDATTIATTSTDVAGNFTLQFPDVTKGMGYLSTLDGKSYFVILNDQHVVLEGTSFDNPAAVKVIKGEQNKAFVEYATHQPKREQVLSAWDYLFKNYTTDPLFKSKTKPTTAIQTEINRLDQEEQDFLQNLPKDSFVKWFLPVRKLVSNVSVIAQYRTSEIPATLQSLRNIDYSDERLYKSGLFKEAIDNHLWFIENSSGALDLVFKDLNTSIDIILEQLKGQDEKYNTVANYMFDLLEKRSLFTSAEYLSNSLLKSDECDCLNDLTKKKFEKYRKMATGATAPDIVFTEYTYLPQGVFAEKLSDLKSNYYLVVFAAGWCPHCVEAMPKIKELYPNLKEKSIEVVLVSLDENAKDFAKYAAPLPFVSTTDYKKWDGVAAVDYQIYSTPTYYMLDNKLEILMKFNSVEHIKSWVEYKIK
jgi:thiol-disulfide isomerase/thioredoxin